MSEKKIDFVTIEPLLLDSQLEGRTMICRFRQPGTGEEIEARSTIRKADDLKSKVVGSVKQGVMREVRRMAFRTLRGVLGHGAGARLGSSVLSSVMSDTAGSGAAFTESEKQTAILEAFMSVANLFHFDEETGTWARPPAPSEFEQRLRQAPVTNNYDRTILEKMVVHLAGASGGIDESESFFLAEQMGLTPLKIEELLLHDAVLAVEVEEVSEEVKETFYLLLCAVALADRQLDAAEEAQLDRYARMLDLEPAQAAELALIAKRHILDSALSLHISQKSLLALADELKMDHREAQRCLIRFKKRNYN